MTIFRDLFKARALHQVPPLALLLLSGCVVIAIVSLPFIRSVSVRQSVETIGVIGKVEATENHAVRITGWVCRRGRRASVRVRIYAENLNRVGGKRYLGAALAAKPSSVKVSSKRYCDTPGFKKHRFDITLTRRQIRNHRGAMLYVYGAAANKDKAPELNNSSRFTIPLSNTEEKTPEKVIGKVDSIKQGAGGSVQITGWACQTGLKRSVIVHAYAGKRAGKKYFLAATRSELAGTDLISSRKYCGTSGFKRHRFSIHLPGETLDNHVGKNLYVYGLSIRGQVKHRLNYSGRYKIADPTQIIPVVNDPSRTFPLFRELPFPRKKTDYTAYWNPFSNDDDDTRRVQLIQGQYHIAFWGDGSDCSLINKVPRNYGPVSNARITSIAEAERLTGIPFGNDNTLRWQPVRHRDKCTYSGNKGSSFIHLTRNGELGLYTHTGPGDFFVPFSRHGQDGKGANKYISGSFFSHYFDRDVPLHPWRSDAKNQDDNLFKIISLQAVPVMKVHSKTYSINQVKQQMVVSLMNQYCLNVMTNKDKRCGIVQAKLMFHIAIKRNTNQHQILQPDNSVLFLDPAQGNLPVFTGGIARQGEATYFKGLHRNGRAVDLWNSLGSPTQYQTFDSFKSFSVSISFRQWMNILDSIVARKESRIGADLSKITDQDRVKWFGPFWWEPNQWIIGSINFSQEVRNAMHTTNESAIGGGVRDMAFVFPEQ